MPEQPINLFNTAPSISPKTLTKKSEFIGSDINKSFGESQYDVNTPVSMVESGEFSYLRGERQSRLDKLGNAVPRLLSKVGTEIAKTPAYLYALGEAGLTDKTLAESLDNAWLNNLDKLDQSVKEQFAIYKPKSVREGNLWDNLTSTSFWTDEGVDGAGFLLSMMAPGAALKATGLATKLAKVPGLAKVGQANIELGQATLLNTALESAAETKGIVDNLNEQFKLKVEQGEINPDTGKPWTESEAKEAIGNAAVNTFTMNMALLTVPNTIMNKNLLGRFGQSKTILDEFKDATGKFVTTNPVVKKSLLKEYAKNIGEASLSEGFLEEAGQTTIENYNQKVALNQTNAGILEGLAKEYIETLSTTEGQKSILLGAVLGSLGGIVGTKRKLKAEDKTRTSLSQLINDNFEGFSTSMNDIFEKDENGIVIDPQTGSPKINIEAAAEVISNIVKEQQSTNLQDLEALKGNKDMYDYIFNQQLSRFALPYLKQEGGIEVLNQHIDNLSNQLFQGKPDISETEHKQQVKSQIKDLQKVYDSLSETIQALPLENLSRDEKLVGAFSNKLLNTAYAESSKQLFLNKQIDQVNKDLLTLNANAAGISQFTIEREKLINRLNNLNTSLKISKENYKNIFDPKQQLEAFNNFSKQNQVIKEEVKKAEVVQPVTNTKGTVTTPIETPAGFTSDPEANEVISNLTLADFLPTGQVTEDGRQLTKADDIFDQLFNEENGEELSEALTKKKQLLEEEKQISDLLDEHSENEEMLKSLSKDLQTLKSNTDFSLHSKAFQDKINNTLDLINTVKSEESPIDDLINSTSNNTATQVSDNTRVGDIVSPGIQEPINANKSFTTKVYNAVMMKLFEHTLEDGKFRWKKNKDGEAIRTNTQISMSVNDPTKINIGTPIEFVITELTSDQLAENEANIEASKQAIKDSKELPYTKEDKEFGEFYTESIGIKDLNTGDIIGFIAIPHSININDKDDPESIQARFDTRKSLIEQRKKIIDRLSNGEKVESVIYAKGPGKLLLKTKDSIPVMGDIVSRPQDLVNGKDIYVVDKGRSEDGTIIGFSIPNEEKINKKALEELKKAFENRTFVSKENAGIGRVYKAVRNANGSWSLIPVYAKNITESKAKSILNTLRNFYNKDTGTVDVKTVMQSLGKDIYITPSINTEKKGALQIDKFKVNGIQWSEIFSENRKEKYNNLLEHIQNSKFNLTTQRLNVDNNVKNILETNAYQEEGQFFVQPYLEFEGIQGTESLPKEETKATPINSTESIEGAIDIEDLETDPSKFNHNDLNDEVFSRTTTKGTLDRGKVVKFLQDKLPGLTLADVETTTEVKPHLKDAVGMFYRSTIYLFKGATDTTAYHEAFHGVFRNMLSIDERLSLIAEAKKTYEAPTQDQLDRLKETITLKLTPDQLDKVVEQLYYEEKLADSFADYTEAKQTRTLGQKIKDFFNKIFKVFKVFRNYNENQINTLFENINIGKFKEKSKQPIYNRNITTELLTPAYSLPEGMSLAEFLDRSKSIEDTVYFEINKQLKLGVDIKNIQVGRILDDIKAKYLAKAIELKKEGKLRDSAVAANVNKFYPLYVEQVKKNLEKRKIKLNIKSRGDLQATESSVIPDTTNNTEDMSIEQVETGINKSYGQDITAVSGIRSAGDKLKLFLSALPILDGGKVKIDNYGFEQFYDYEKLYYQLELALLGKKTFEEQLETVQELATYKPEMKQVALALESLSANDPIIKQFRTNFYKQQLKFKLVLFEKNRGTDKYSFKIVDSNRTNVERSIQQEWEENLLDPSRTKNNLVKFENSEYKLDPVKVSKLVEEVKSTESTESFVFDTLFKVGIEYKKEDFTKIYNSNPKKVNTNLQWYLNKLDIEAQGKIDDETTRASFRNGRKALQWFVDQQLLFNQNLYTESFNNVEDSVVYTIQHNSFASRLLNKLTTGDADSFIAELKRDPMYKYSSLLEDGNNYLVSAFAIDGLKDGIGENKGKKYRGIHPDDYTAMAIAAYINPTGSQSMQGTPLAVYTPIVPSEKTQAFLTTGPKYSQFLFDEKGNLIQTEDTQRFNNIFYSEAERIKQAFKEKELYESETQLIAEGKLGKRNFHPNPNYHYKKNPSAFDGNAFKFNILNFTEALEPNGSLYKEFFEAFLQSNQSAKDFTNTFNNGKFNLAVTKEVLNSLQTKYNEQLADLINRGIIKTDEVGKLTSNIIDLSTYNSNQKDTDSKLKHLVLEFTLNTALFNMEYSMLMNGDPAFYKNKDDWGKRFYQSQASTQSYDSSDFTDGKIKIMAFNDVETSAEEQSYDDILDMTKDLPNAEITKSILDNNYMGKSDINVADAQFYVTDDLFTKMLKAQGKDDTAIKKALSIANGATEGINSKDYHQQIAIQKTFTFGVEWNDKLSRYEPKQIKCAILPLTRSLVSSNPLLEKAYIKMKSNPEGPQAIAFKSTFKALQPVYQNITDVDTFNEDLTVDLEVENMGLQVDNPNHGLDDDNSSTRQLKMLFYGMMDNDTTYGDMKGIDIKNLLQELEATNNEESLKELVELFNNKDARLLKMIQEAITKRNATSIIEKVFTIDANTGDFLYPLDTLPTRQTIELLSSIFTKNVVLQNFRGGAMVQATSLGFQFESQFKTLEEQQVTVEATPKLKELQTSLKWITKKDAKTIDYIEVALPYYYSDFLDKNGQFKKDIPEELLKIIGYRIPTEGAHSMLPLKVVKFLPKEYGNVILLPYEITKQMGADFDFDKIYFLSRDYYMKGQQLVPYSYNLEDSKDGLELRYFQYVNSVLNENKDALKAKQDARKAAKELNKLSKAAGEEEYKYSFEDDLFLLQDEGYIITKEEFAKKPIKDQLTKESRKNKILDLYTMVLRDVNTLNSLISPSGPGEIADVFEQVEKYKKAEKQDYFSFLGQLKIKKLFDDIIGLKGQSALKVTGHSFVTLGNLTTEGKGFKYKEGNNVILENNLSKIESKVGGKIVEELSSMMAAILDAVKTPTLLPYLNISSKTIDVWATIVRYGMGTKVASQFTSQEAIGIISERSLSNDKQIKDGQEYNNQIVKETFDYYKGKFYEQFNTYRGDKDLLIKQLFGNEYSEDVKSIEKALKSGVLDLNNIEVFAGKSIKDVSKEDLVKFYATQLQVISSFDELSNISKDLSKIDSIFGLNKEVGPTFETVNGKQELIKEVTKLEESFKGVNDLLNQPIIKSYIDINDSFFEILNDKFSFANEYYNNIKNQIGSISNAKNDRGLLGIKPEDRDNINSFIRTYLDAYTSMSGIYKQSAEEAGFTDRVFIDEITKLKSSKFDPEYQWNIFGGKKLTLKTKQRLTNSALLQHLKTKIVKNSDIKTVQLKGNRLELTQKEKIINDINSFYKNPNTKPMILALLGHSFKYSGFYKGTNSFHTLIDPQILDDLNFIENRKIVRNLINDELHEVNNSIFVDRMIDQYIRNNPKAIKTFDLNKQKGETLLTKTNIEGKDIYTFDVKSKHTRASELFKVVDGITIPNKYINIYLNETKEEGGFKGRKMFIYDESYNGYREISTLGIKGALIEMNPFFDLDKSSYPFNNYIKYTEEIPDTLIQSEDTTAELESKTSEEMLDDQIVDEYNNLTDEEKQELDKRSSWSQEDIEKINNTTFENSFTEKEQLTIINNMITKMKSMGKDVEPAEMLLSIQDAYAKQDPIKVTSKLKECYL